MSITGSAFHASRAAHAVSRAAQDLAKPASEPAPAPAPAPVAAGGARPGTQRVHHVRPGDTVQTIAQQHGTTPAVLFDLNPSLDPRHRPPGGPMSRDHFGPAHLEGVDRVRLPDAGPSDHPLRAMAGRLGALVLARHGGPAHADPAAQAVRQATDEVLAIPAGAERAEAVADQAARIEKAHGHQAAVDFVAAVAARDPRGFGQSITEFDMRGGRFDDATRDLLGEGLAQACERTPLSPYTSPGRFAAALVGGLSDGLAGTFVNSTLLADLVGRSGHDGLQADFVRSGLSLSLLNAQALESGQVAPIHAGPSAHLVASLAPAVQGSTAAAQEVIRFAQDHDMPFIDDSGQRGPGALRIVLELFSMVQVQRPDGRQENGAVNFLRTAAGANGALGDRESLTLFLAMGGASTSGTGLLEMDGPGGKSDPAATELTATLFEQYFQRWVGNPSLGIVNEGNLLPTGAAGSPFAGVDLKGAFETFFKEALLDPNEDGAYRQGLLSHVLGTVFQAFDPQSDLTRALGQDGAATLAGSLLGLMETSQVGLIGDLREASQQQQRLFSLLAVVSVAAGGAGAATLVSGTVGKVLLAALVEAAKTGGRIQVESLVRQGLDEDTARVVAGYANGDMTIEQAFAGSQLFKDLQAAGIGPEKLQALVTQVQSELRSGQFTLSEIIVDALNILDNDAPPELKARIAEIQRQLEQGLETQRSEMP